MESRPRQMNVNELDDIRVVCKQSNWQRIVVAPTR